MQAIILHRKDFREYDEIISLYTLEAGKIDALARSVKKITSKNSAHLEPFSLVEAEIIKGQEVQHIIKSRGINIFPNIRQDIIKMSMASFVVRLYDLLIEVGERDENIFYLLQSWLEFLETYSEPTAKLVLGLEIKLLDRLGFTPILGDCGLNHEGLPEDNFFFYPAGGMLLCPNCGRIKKQAGEEIVQFSRKLKDSLNILLNGRWEKISELVLSKEELNNLDEAVYLFLRYHSEKKVPRFKGL